MMNWIKVTDKLPDKQDGCYGYDGIEFIEEVWYDQNEKKWRGIYIDKEWEWYGITHWCYIEDCYPPDEEVKEINSLFYGRECI